MDLVPPLVGFCLCSIATAGAVPARQVANPPTVSEILERTKLAIADQVFRLHGGFAGGEVQFDEEAKVRWFQQGARIIERTELPARGCRGGDLGRMLVVEWELRGGVWLGQGRPEMGRETLDPVVRVWRVDPSEITDVGERVMNGITARGLRYPYVQAPQAGFSASGQVMWFDVATWLPIRWELLLEGQTDAAYWYWFDHLPEASLAIPDTVPRVTCVGPPVR